MEYKLPDIQVDGSSFELITIKEFKQRRGLREELPYASLAYNFKNGKIDYVKIGTTKLVVWNEKAQEFTMQDRAMK